VVSHSDIPPFLIVKHKPHVFFSLPTSFKISHAFISEHKVLSQSQYSLQIIIIDRKYPCYKRINLILVNIYIYGTTPPKTVNYCEK
jgi:hypothetical protein